MMGFEILSNACQFIELVGVALIVAFCVTAVASLFQVMLGVLGEMAASYVKRVFNLN